MKVSRRQFLKLCGLSGVALSVSPTLLPKFAEALERALGGNPPVIWIQGAGCTGCSVSLLNAVSPDIQDILLKIISLKFHPTVMAAQGETAIDYANEMASKYKGKFFLVVEGAIPTGSHGAFCVVGEKGGKEVTIVDWTKDLAKKAAGVLAFGTCAAYGGLPAAKPNPTNAKGVGDILKEAEIRTPCINVPGCPPHPDWMAGTIAHVLLYGIPKLDEVGRPVLFYGSLVHDNCPYRSYFEEEEFCEHFGETGCRYELGCKGPMSHCDSWKRRWNNGVNWCVENALCIGCTEPNFWDEFAPLYEPS